MDLFSVQTTLLQGLALGLTAAASPGPFQAFLIGQTLHRGWRRGAVVALSPLISDGPIVLLILLALNQLPGLLLRGISLAGGLFLLYVAWGLWRNWQEGAHIGSSAHEKGGSHRGGLWRGALVNSLSPGPWTFWALVNGPLLLSAWRRSGWEAGAFLVGFYGTLIGGFIGIALLFHQARRMGSRVARVMVLISVIILVGFALLLIYRGAAG